MKKNRTQSRRRTRLRPVQLRMPSTPLSRGMRGPPLHTPTLRLRLTPPLIRQATKPLIKTGPAYFSGTIYTLAEFGSLRFAIDYYIDSLTLVMFMMVTLIATLIHLFAIGYMSDELTEDHEDHQVHTSHGHLHRPGRYYRFFAYLSLFSFSMLGLVLAGNIFMVFIFWELVGICSYFLIGFYTERKIGCGRRQQGLHHEPRRGLRVHDRPDDSMDVFRHVSIHGPRRKRRRPRRPVRHAPRREGRTPS